MHAYRVTVITAEGERLVRHFVASGQAEVHERLDREHPDRRMTLCMALRTRPRAQGRPPAAGAQVIHLH